MQTEKEQHQQPTQAVDELATALAAEISALENPYKGKCPTSELAYRLALVDALRVVQRSHPASKFLADLVAEGEHLGLYDESFAAPLAPPVIDLPRQGPSGPPSEQELNEGLICAEFSNLRESFGPEYARGYRDAAQILVRDVVRWRACEDICHHLSDERGDFVVVSLRKPDGIFRSTTDSFRFAIDALVQEWQKADGLGQNMPIAPHEKPACRTFEEGIEAAAQCMEGRAKQSDSCGAHSAALAERKGAKAIRTLMYRPTT